MTTIKIISAEAIEIQPRCYVVEAGLSGGGVTRHEGPRKAWFFTKEQARKLARRVNDTLTIDLTYWDTGDANEY
jgi:hypothetical protein